MHQITILALKFVNIIALNTHKIEEKEEKQIWQLGIFSLDQKLSFKLLNVLKDHE
jgi:hypothetical protein